MDIKAATSQPDINSVLQQMRQIRQQTQAGVGVVPTELDVGITNKVADPARSEFGGALKTALDAVNGLQQSAAASQTAFATGQETDLVKVMVESQKASVGFQAMVQVRNRMVTAYQDIMKMPI